MPHFQTTPISIVALIFYPILSHSIPFYPSFSKVHSKIPTGWMLENPPHHSFNREVPASTFGASASVFFFPMVASCATGATKGRRRMDFSGLKPPYLRVERGKTHGHTVEIPVKIFR